MCCLVSLRSRQEKGRSKGHHQLLGFLAAKVPERWARAWKQAPSKGHHKLLGFGPSGREPPSTPPHARRPTALQPQASPKASRLQRPQGQRARPAAPGSPGNRAGGGRGGVQLRSCTRS